jgi:hypothetical protein
MWVRTDLTCWIYSTRNRRITAMDGTDQQTYTAADLEAARVGGRREADNALDWHTSCLGCAGRLDSLYAERVAGADDAVRGIVEDLRAAYEQTRDRAYLHAVVIALSHGTQPAETSVEPVALPNGGAVPPGGSRT